MRITWIHWHRWVALAIAILLVGFLVGGSRASQAASLHMQPVGPAGVFATTARLLGSTPTATTSPVQPTVSPSATATASASPAVSATATPTAPQLLPGSPTPAWWQMTNPNIGRLGGVAAGKSDDVWATGSGILHWAGAVWQTAPAPTPADPTFAFAKASAAAVDSIWAVGNTDFDRAVGVAHWNGQAWTLIYYTPGLLGPDISPGAELHDVTAYAADGAYAVRVDYNITNANSILLQCTGTTCTPIATAAGGYLTIGYGVAGFSATNAWLVGVQVADPGGPATTLLLHWDGQTLQSVPSPDIGELDGIAGSAPDDIWAVGGGGILHWDGLTWRQVPSPAGARTISARARDDAWAVGDTGFLHWDGQTWQLVPGARGTLNSILALATADAWAVGADAQDHSLIERYTSLPAFADVPVTAPFYPYIAWMADRGYISGYTCGGPSEPCDAYTRPYFRSGANVTRAQLLKMVVAAAAWPLLTPPTPTFADVPTSSPFYAVIETGAAHGIISGYTCGGPGEPCDPQQRPYFRPYANITRGQLAKVISLARGYPLPAPTPPTFADVPPSHPFYGYIEAVAAQGVVSGYSCGGPGEPCPGVYFRPGNSATRGQVAKFVTLAYQAPRQRAP